MTFSQAKRRKALARWHRRLALIVALWLVLLAASGILINHAHDWKLDRKPVPAPLQDWLYGIDLAAADYCQAGFPIGDDCHGVFAQLVLAPGSLLLSEDYLYLLDEAGQLLEKLNVGQLGLDGLQAGLRDGPRIYLRDTGQTILTDPDLSSREKLSSSSAASLSERDWREKEAASEWISWERLLLDLHAARFLGPLAVIFSDLMAGLILILAVTGLWLYRNTRGRDSS